MYAGVLLILVGLLSSCGSGSGSTSGTLSVDDITLTSQGGGIYSVFTVATYTPSGSAPLPNTPISYTATFVGNTTTTRSATDVSSDGAGKIQIGPWSVNQDTVPIVVTITAKTGGLSSTKVTSIPASSPLTVTPQAIAFPNTATAGATATVAVTGGTSPYLVSSSAPGDIKADISGATVTLTKLTVSGLTNTTATVTVTDNRGAQQSITVGYFK